MILLPDRITERTPNVLPDSAANAGVAEFFEKVAQTPRDVVTAHPSTKRASRPAKLVTKSSISSCAGSDLTSRTADNSISLRCR